MEKDESKQFDEIMGRIPKQTVTKMTNRAVEGAAQDIQEGSPEINGLPAHLEGYPRTMVGLDEHGFHAIHHSNYGWVHKWYGGHTVHHHHDFLNPEGDHEVDVTSYFGKDGKKPTFTPEEFAKEGNEWSSTTGKEYLEQGMA